MVYMGNANPFQLNIFGEFADNFFNTFTDLSRDFYHYFLYKHSGGTRKRIKPYNVVSVEIAKLTNYQFIKKERII